MKRHLLICGERGVGKSTLIRRLRRAQFANLRVEIFKPCVDTRYSDEEVVSHDAHAIRSTPVESAQNILLLTSIPHRRVRASGTTRRRILSGRATAARASAIRRSLTALARSSLSPHRAAVSS